MTPSALLVAAFVFAGLAIAQNQSLTIDPNSVPIERRQDWCRAQTASCRPICGGSADTNTCDANALSYECICADGSTPNISDYQQTLPFHICEEWRGQCVTRSLDDRDAQDACLSVQCGQRNASALEATTSTSASAEPTSTDESETSTDDSATATGDAEAAATSTGAAAALTLANDYGAGLLTVGMLALFGLAL